jgi:hypothetical protein
MVKELKLKIIVLCFKYPFIQWILSILLYVSIVLKNVTLAEPSYPFDGWSSQYYIDNVEMSSTYVTSTNSIFQSDEETSVIDGNSTAEETRSLFDITQDLIKAEATPIKYDSPLFEILQEFKRHTYTLSASFAYVDEIFPQDFWPSTKEELKSINCTMSSYLNGIIDQARLVENPLEKEKNEFLRYYATIYANAIIKLNPAKVDDLLFYGEVYDACLNSITKNSNKIFSTKTIP